MKALLLISFVVICAIIALIIFLTIKKTREQVAQSDISAANLLSFFHPVNKNQQFVRIKGGNKGLYCSDTTNGLVCNTQTPGAWETFLAEYQPDGTFSLKGSRAQQYCSDTPDGIVCNRTGVSVWEKFKANLQEDKSVSLVGGRDGKLCSDNANNSVSKVACNKDSVGPWEKFTIENVPQSFG